MWPAELEEIDGVTGLVTCVICRWWAVTGLGARGLVYHAWLGAVLAEAVFADDESILAPELLRWQPESEEDE